MPATKLDIPDTQRQLTISLPADRPNVCVGADTYSIIISGADTRERFAFIDMLIPPGGGPVPHAHEAEETFYVTEGEIAVFCHDSRVEACTGGCVSVPGGAPHCFKNLTTVPARLFCIVAGAGLEKLFLEVGPRVATRVTPPPPVSPEQLAEMMKKLPELSQRYGARMLAPDTFDHLMTEAELRLVKSANGEAVGAPQK